MLSRDGRSHLARDAAFSLAAFLALSAAGVALAEPREIAFRRISLREGLSQATIHAIAQDRSGFMWFGTQEGLNRYDGSTFAVFSHDPKDPGSLSHNYVYSLAVGPTGDLWIGTDGGGLNRFDQATQTFIPYRSDPGDPTSLSSDRIRATVFDREGTLWVGTDGGGLNRFDPVSGTFASFTHDPSQPGSLSSDRVSSVAVDRQGTVWVGTDGGGLDRLDEATGTFHHHRHDPADPASLSDDNVKSLFADRDDNLWVGTYEGGLNRLDRRGGGFARFAHRAGDPRALSGNRIRAVFQDSSGSLWIGTSGGLNERAPGDRDFRAYRHDPLKPTSLDDDRIVSIFEDRGGVLWVGTYSGLNTWNTRTGSFALFQSDPSERSLSGNVVTAFHEDPDGAMWVGTYGGGLNRYDRAAGSFSHHRHDPGDPASLSDNRVMSLHVDRQGVLWAGTLGGGLNRLDRRRGRFARFVHDPEDPSSLGANGVTAILEDSHGQLWVGTYRGGLNRLERRTGSFARFQSDPATPAAGPSSDRVSTLYEDASGALWIGTDGGGLNRLDAASGRFSHYRHDPAEPRSLSSDQVYSVLEDRRGILWVGTQNGLSKWLPEYRRRHEPSFTHYARREGLLSSVVYGILEDRRGNLWLSTNRGLSEFDPITETFRHFDSSQGLQSNDFNTGAYYLALDGTMFFGGGKGFNAFDPTHLKANRYVPPVLITSFLKFNRPFDLGRPVSGVGTIPLTYKDSVIAFDFVALDYTAPEKNRYMHMLEGFDRDWVDAGRLRRATYTNLDPGTYTFRVKAANNDGVWNEEGAAVQLVVAPPPWASWQAYGVYALLVAAAAVSFSRAQARKRERAVALERTNRSLELEIHERRRAEGELRKLSSAVEQSPASVMITDPQGLIEYVNPKFEEITGYSAAEVVGKSPAMLQSGYTTADTETDLWRTARAGREWRGELHSRKKNGELFWEYASVSPIKSADGDIRHILAVNEDITVRKEYEERLLHQANFDPLTELPNRTLAFDRLSRALVGKRDRTVAILCVDLDNFKIVNDTLGHATGDELLVRTAGRLTATVAASDTVARLGGDEFLVILNDLDTVAEAEAAAARILSSFARPFDLDGRDIFITASLGTTLSPADGDDPHVLLRNADAAKNKAKEQGRGSSRFFTPAMNEQARRRLGLESSLRKAIGRNDELRVEFQPIFDAASGRPVGAEALLRWSSPALGEVSPETFVPIAEEIGLIDRIGEWVLREGCRQAQSWCEQTGLPMRMAVNVSSRQFQSGDLVAVIRRVLDETGLPAECLELEVTERLLLEDEPEIQAMLAQLSEAGIRLSIDDFGTGYSALSYLKKYPFDILKIDRSFIAGMTDDPEAAAVVNAIIAMGHSLGLEVIAEGVETEQQAAHLRAKGCDMLQGFCFSRALPATSLAGLLERRHRGDDAPPARPRLVASGG